MSDANTIKQIVEQQDRQRFLLKLTENGKLFGDWYFSGKDHLKIKSYYSITDSMLRSAIWSLIKDVERSLFYLPFNYHLYILFQIFKTLIII